MKVQFCTGNKNLIKLTCMYTQQKRRDQTHTMQTHTSSCRGKINIRVCCMCITREETSH